MRRSEVEAVSELGSLLGERLWPDPHSADAFGHCVSFLPEKLDSTQAATYAKDVLARWNSNDWLVNGQDQQEYRFQ